ncbi:MAG: energy-coupling factor ABC transporter ATP-binding protein [Armatimonadota bacterium]
MSKTIFKASNVSYSYHGTDKPVLRDIGFEIADGERVAILGANASGKSTLLHMLDGLYFADTGKIEAYGTELTEDSVETPPFSREFRQKVGFLFQNSDAQLFCASVEEELAFGPLQLRLTPEEIETRISQTLQMIGIEHLRGRSPQTLSGGEKKKVALAGLITCAPKVILMDEPTSGLDPRTQQWLVEFMQMLHSIGVTLVTASHDLSFVSEVSDRALILSEDHKVVYDGPVMDALNDLDLLLSVNLIHAHTHKHGSEEHIHPHLHEALHDHPHSTDA